MPFLLGPNKDEKKMETLQNCIIQLDESLKQMTKQVDEMRQSLDRQGDDMKQIIQDSAFNRVNKIPIT